MAFDRRGDRPAVGNARSRGEVGGGDHRDLERDQQRLDEAALKWGIEKVVSSGTVKVGSASQSFSIDVAP